jgi:hypothetical protein
VDGEPVFDGHWPCEGDRWEDVAAAATKDYTTDEDDGSFVPVDEHDFPAICLWP